MQCSGRTTLTNFGVEMIQQSHATMQGLTLKLEDSGYMQVTYMVQVTYIHASYIHTCMHYANYIHTCKLHTYMQVTYILIHASYKHTDTCKTQVTYIHAGYIQ